MNLQEKVLSYKDDVVKSIQEAVRIKSVEEAPLEGMPFGKGPAEALQYFLDLAENMGFKTENFGNYAGHIDFGDGEEMLGILGHVDVVPEGDGWDHPPYSGDIAEGKIYGRGVLDNKGPSIACLYAMKAIKDSGLPLNKKIRIILGANEETGWKCMEHYFDTLKMPQPDIAFTPDSAFPVTFAEKGIMQVVFEKDFSEESSVEIEGGTAFNSVPDRAVAKLPLAYKEKLAAELEAFNSDKPYKINLSVEGEKCILTSLGKASHAARPHNGYNAINALMSFFAGAGIKDAALEKATDFFNKRVKMEYNGVSMGVGFEDEVSGKLTLNVGKISLKGKHLSIGIDMRCPVTVERNAIFHAMEKAAAEESFNLTIKSESKALYVPKDSFLVKTLMDTYYKLTGDYEAQPVAIGGGTYARAVKNGVAFGALLKDQEDNMHQRNESLEIDKLDTWLKIYVEAIYNLAK